MAGVGAGLGEERRPPGKGKKKGARVGGLGQKRASEALRGWGKKKDRALGDSDKNARPKRDGEKERAWGQGPDERKTRAPRCRRTLVFEIKSKCVH